MDLLADQLTEDYANQIKLPPIPSGPDAQAATDLHAVIRGCLRSYMSNRLQAHETQDMLFQTMIRHGWTNQIDKPSKRKARAERHKPEGCATATAQLQALQQLASTSNLSPQPFARSQLPECSCTVTTTLSHANCLSTATCQNQQST